MSLRPRIAAGIISAGLLAVPVTASAQPSDPSDAHSYISGQRSAPAVEATEPAGSAVNDGDGPGTLAVIAIAGGTLLAGAAAGFEGGRVLTRHRAVRS